MNAQAGSDTGNTGLGPSDAFATLQKAAELVTHNTTIFVANGTYHNTHFGTGSKSNAPAVHLQDLEFVTLASLPGHRPRIEFDGVGGISGQNMRWFEVRGFEVMGPNGGISYDEAVFDRSLHSAKYSGRGITISGGHHIHIHSNVVHHAPNAGIRVDGADYCTIEENVVYNSTWWSSNAESGIVLALSQSIDLVDEVKMRVRKNTVFGNVNRIPYYKHLSDDQIYPTANHVLPPGQPSYGSLGQLSILDGAGIYVARNIESYTHGSFEISANLCFGNGIEGVAVHKTVRIIVRDNVIYANGEAPREPSASGELSTGITLTGASNVTLWNNTVSTVSKDDYAFMIDSSSALVAAGASSIANSVCYGRLSAAFSDSVERHPNCIAPPMPPASPPAPSPPPPP